MKLNIRLKTLVILSLILMASVTQALETTPVTHHKTARYFHLDGIVEAINQTTVSAQTQGKVTNVFFDVDDYVEKGELIIQLDSTEQQAQVIKSQASVEETKALYLKAKQEYHRNQTLFNKKLVSKSSLDEAQAQYQALKARFDAANAVLTQAREQLSYTKINAPYSGIVINRHVEIGELVQPGKPLVTGLSLDNLRVSIQVPQSLINKVRQFGRVEIIHPETHEIIAPTQITIFPFADPVTNTFQVRLTLPTETHLLFPGMFIKASIVVGEKTHLSIPSSSIVNRSEVTGVYVVNKDSQVSFRQIRPGGENRNGSMIILSGLEEGESVALNPIEAGTLLNQQRKEKPDKEIRSE